MTENSPSLEHITEMMEELRAYAGKTVVVKIGGNSIAEDPGFLPGIARQIEFLHSRHIQIVVVHGGGPQIDRALLAAGITPVKGPDGRRLTDPATMTCVAKVMAEISEDVAASLQQAGCEVAVPARDDHHVVIAAPSSADPADRTGKPARVDLTAVLEPLRSGKIVLLNSVGYGEDGRPLNINADDYAMAVAVALKAHRLFMATNVAGVYGADKQPISLLTPGLAHTLMQTGVISGGMIPKIESALAALAAGVDGVAILDAHKNWALLGEILTRQGFATLITTG